MLQTYSPTQRASWKPNAKHYLDMSHRLATRNLENRNKPMWFRFGSYWFTILRSTFQKQSPLHANKLQLIMSVSYNHNKVWPNADSLQWWAVRLLGNKPPHHLNLISQIEIINTIHQLLSRMFAINTHTHTS